MRAVLTLLAALALSGCSLVFPDSSYTGGDGGNGAIDAAFDAGAIDAGGIDAGDRDAGDRDAAVDGGDIDAASPPEDGGPPSDGGVLGAWPTCGNSVTESAGLRDAHGVVLTLTDPLYLALFGSAGAAGGEAGLIADRQVPDAPADVVDVAIATGPGLSSFVVATADEVGGLWVRTVSLAGSLSLGATYPITWPPAGPPMAIERIAMRTVGGTTLLVVIGTGASGARAWRCSVETASVACTVLPIASTPERIRTAAVFGNAAGEAEALLIGRDTDGGYALRPTDGDFLEGPRGYRSGDRVSGTGGPLVVSPVFGVGDPFAYWLGLGGFVEHDLGIWTGPSAAVFLGPDTYAMAQAQPDGAGGFEVGTRAMTCTATGCVCPGEASGDCRGTDAFSTRTIAGRDARFVEVERARDAVLVVAGEGEGTGSSSGTEVVLYAFDRATSAPIDPGPGVESLVLGSGMGGSAFAGTLAPGYGMRIAVRASGSEVVLMQVALVDLEASGSTTREVFVSALRICRAR